MVGLLGLQQVQDAPRPLLGGEHQDKILVSFSDSAFVWSQLSPPWSFPLWLCWAHQPSGTSPVSRAWYLPQDQPQLLPSSLAPSCVPQQPFVTPAAPEQLQAKGSCAHPWGLRT